MHTIAGERRFFLRGPVGRLEAIVRPAGDESTAWAALLCHPHPLFGGTMENKTLYRVARELASELEIPSLRFNFRGAGQSEGSHDAGVGELEDTSAALDSLEQLYPAARIVAIGYSFGAAIGLKSANLDDRVACLVALGLPLDLEWSVDFFAKSPKPRIVIQGERDEFGDAARVRAFVSRSTSGPGSPLQTHIVATADHLFRGHEDRAAGAVLDFVRNFVAMQD